MKKINLTCLSFGIFGLFFSSCLQEKNLYNPDNENQDDDKVGLFADFSLRTEVSVIIHATDINGKDAEGVRFGVYTSEPCLNEDGKLENPAFTGYTNEAGQLEAKVVVPKNISRLYIIPLSAGYVEELPSYDIQDVITASFTAVPFPTTNSRTRAAEDDTYQINYISNNYPGLCILYKDTEVSSESKSKGIPIPSENGGSALVSKDPLSTDFTDKVNKLYPEKKNVTDADLSKNSDLEVVDTNGAEVWVTYIGDGNFSQNNKTVYNSLMYYNYTENDLSSMSHTTPTNLHMTMLLPNTNQIQCPTGLRVQLLYWDGQQYSKTFPKGTRIGFAVARSGYNGNFPVTNKSAYNFKSTDFPKTTNNNIEGNYYSTPQLNKVAKSQAVTRRIDGYDYCVTGFDIRLFGDPQSDYDFNDVLIAISSSPVKAIQPGVVIDPVEEVIPPQSTYGTLAFEDLWPSQGDYDMNDFVVNYAYNLGKDKSNKITQITLEFEPIAKGAAGSTEIGFGIELPINKNNINSCKGAVLEEDNNNTTLIVWNYVSNDIPQFNGTFINTDKGKNKVTAEKVNVTITLTSPIEAPSTLNFNPFIFVGDRSHEIHLPDHKPTAKMSEGLLGSGADRSDGTKNRYYRMENGYTWALDFPRETKDAPAWRYPKEHSSVTTAYPNYAAWITGGDYSWFEEKNATPDEIY